MLTAIGLGAVTLSPLTGCTYQVGKVIGRAAMTNLSLGRTARGATDRQKLALVYP